MRRKKKSFRQIQGEILAKELSKSNFLSDASKVLQLLLFVFASMSAIVVLSIINNRLGIIVILTFGLWIFLRIVIAILETRKEQEEAKHKTKRKG